MPIPGKIVKAPQENIRYLNHNDLHSNSTGTPLILVNDLINSDIKDKPEEILSGNTFKQESTQYSEIKKMLFKYNNIISNEYYELSEFYKNISLEEIKSSTTPIIIKLLSFSPDAFSLELTNEESIFYTFKKNDFSIYIQQFFETEEDGFNASLITYKGDNKIKSTNGDIYSLLNVIDQKFSHTKLHN